MRKLSNKHVTFSKAVKLQKDSISQHLQNKTKNLKDAARFINQKNSEEIRIKKSHPNNERSGLTLEQYPDGKTEEPSARMNPESRLRKIEQ